MIKNGVRWGLGVMKWTLDKQKGNKYYGEFKDGKVIGKGMMFLNNKKI